MNLPRMKYGSGLVRSQQVKFGGLNLTAGAADGDLVDMWNMTSDHYPVLATRPLRYQKSLLMATKDLFCREELYWIVDQQSGEGADLMRNYMTVGTVSKGLKTFGALGDWIIILPDKKAYNTVTGAFRDMESRWVGTMLDFRDGTLYGAAATGNCIACPDVDWSAWFAPGDAVTVAGCTEHPENNGSRIIRQISGNEMYFYENSFTVGTETGDMTISRTVPELEHLCEHSNRLWGCAGNTIYASKLGDPFNWECYDGLESDSYALEVGSPGRFTGCISYGGYPTFFKEDMIYKVYGSYPSNFQVADSQSMGVAEGCHRSLAVAGEVLFYLSRSGVMAYTGGVPQLVSEDLGTEQFLCNAAGSDGQKYYISMRTRAGVGGLYVYDTRRGLWHREDDLDVVAFARKGWDLYALNRIGYVFLCGNHGTHEELDGKEMVKETLLPWRVDFADFTGNTTNQKGVTKLHIRLELEENAICQVSVMYDSDGTLHRVREIIGDGVKQSYYLPLVVRRCDHFKLVISGIGGCKIHSLVKDVYVGSEIRGRN